MTDVINNNKEDDKTNGKEAISQVYPNRLVIVTGDKGGVGKSTFARGLVQTYLDASRSFVGFDADISNSQLVRFYGKDCQIEPLDIFKNGNIDKFFDRLKKMINGEEDDYGQKLSAENLFLLELPPQSRIILQKFVEGMNFLETAAEDHNMRVTMVVVISRISDSVNQLINLHNFCGNRVDYLVVKNLFFGEEEEFTRYDKSEEIKSIKKELEKENTSFIQMKMPELIEHAYDYLDANSMTFKQGMEQKDLPSVKGRVTSWLRNFKEQIKPVNGLLGLNDVELS